MPKITLWITGLHEIMGRDYKIEEPHWGTSVPPRQRLLIFRYPAVTTKKHTLFKTLNNEIVYPVKTQDSENHTLFSGIYLFREFPPAPGYVYISEQGEELQCDRLKTLISLNYNSDIVIFYT